MHRAVPWAFLAIVVLTLSAVTAWPRGKKASAPAPSPPIIQQGTNGSLTLAWRSKPPAGGRFHKVGEEGRAGRRWAGCSGQRGAFPTRRGVHRCVWSDLCPVRESLTCYADLCLLMKILVSPWN